MATPRRDTRAEIDALMDPRVQDELATAVPGFTRAGLLSALLHNWGGQDALARDLYLEFQGAGKGSMARQRILEMIVRLISQDTDATPPVSVEDMGDAELRAALMAIAAEAQAKIGVKDAAS